MFGIPVDVFEVWPEIGVSDDHGIERGGLPCVFEGCFGHEADAHHVPAGVREEVRVCHDDSAVGVGACRGCSGWTDVIKAAGRFCVCRRFLAFRKRRREFFFDDLHACFGGISEALGQPLDVHGACELLDEIALRGDASERDLVPSLLKLFRESLNLRASC